MIYLSSVAAVCALINVYFNDPRSTRLAWACVAIASIINLAKEIA